MFGIARTALAKADLNLMRTFFWILPALASLGLNAPAQPVAAKEDAVIAELLSYSVPAEDWKAHLKKRKQAGWVPPPMPSFVPTAESDIARLVEYWSSEYPPHEDRPDAKVRGRLLAHCEEQPGAFAKLSRWFVATDNNTTGRIRKLHERLASDTTEDGVQARRKTRHWLMTQAGLFREELKKEAELYFATPDDAERRASFDAHLKLEPTEAKALLVRHAAAASPAASPAARCVALLRLHALHDGQEETWRKALQALVTSEAPAEIRAAALARLTKVEWSEKTSWVLDLFKDPALGGVKEIPFRDLEDPTQVALYPLGGNNEEEPLAKIVKAKPDFWVPKIIPLVGNANPAVHDNAVRCLAQFHLQNKREDALRALLPWLSNPRWALNEEHEGRLRLLQSVDMVNLPESVPGLRWVLKHDTAFMRRTAASALAHYQVAEVVPVVRELAAQESNLLDCQQLVSALLELKGVPLDEQVQGVEQLEAQLLTQEGREALEEEDKPFLPVEKKKGLDPARRMPVALGAVLCSGGMFQTEALAHALAERRVKLRTSNPQLANALEARISLWNTPTSRQLLMDRLRAGRMEAPWLARLFKQDPPKSEAELAAFVVPLAAKTESARPLPMTALRSLKDLPENTSAVVALLLEDEGRMHAILSGKNAEAQAMLLACARLQRAALPLAAVGALLDSKHSLCARGAVLYLEAEDSPEARALVLAHFKGEAKILGAHWNHDPANVWTGEMYRTQEKLRKRVMEAKRPREIHALLSEGAWGGEGQVWLEIEDGKASLFHDQGHERLGTRLLTDAELAEFRAYVTQQRVEELPPLDTLVMDGVQYEYLHLTAEGGRRVFMNNPGSFAEQGEKPPEDRNDSVYVCLVKLFEKLVKDKSKLSVGYQNADEVKGLRIVIPKEQQRVQAVMQREGLLMVNTRGPGDDESRWTAVTADGAALPEKAVEGPALNLLNRGFPKTFEVRVDLAKPPWRSAAAGGGHVATATRKEDGMNGLWLCRDKQEPELIAAGSFSSPITSLDGQWVMAYRWENTNPEEVKGFVRIRLSTRELIPLNLPEADMMGVQGRLPDSGKILLSRERQTYEPKAGPEKKEYQLLDPATGGLERVTGEFRPLEDETWRALQPTGEPHVVWAAVPWLDQKSNQWSTHIGRYDLRTFKFTQVINIPRLYFTSMDFWVDQEKRLVYLAEGLDLLSFPLPEEVKQ